MVCGERHLTRRELVRRSGALAERLVELGVRRGEPVALLLHHSVEMVVSVVATVAAGACFVPLEPAQPDGRLETILEGSGVAHVLTESGLASRVPEGLRPVFVDAVEGPWVVDAGAAAPGVEVDAADAAYRIYTSGSTGRPKPVEISHAALVDYLLWARDTYLRGDRLDAALYSSIAFDLTVTSLFLPLLGAGTLRVFPRGDRHFSDLLLEVVEDRRVGWLKLTPSHLRLLAERTPAWRGAVRLVVGGEALDADLAGAIDRLAGGEVEIYNEYGPTEATVGCMVHRFDPRHDLGAVPLGRPAANHGIYLLDRGMRPVAECSTGELHLGGAGLARGYPGRPRQTAAAFVPHPWGRAGERLYRSGDVARWLPGGVLEFLGRRDEQVKIHGYRVELEEIRTALRRHSDVRDAVVRPLDDGAGNRLLVAYYAARHEVPASRLRDHLGELLVEETIPQHFVHLRRLPLTLSGKVAVEALPGLDEIRGRARGELEPPRTPTEEILAGLWSRLLGLERVGIEESFFELGGHSLLAAQLVARVRELFAVELGVRDVFEEPTVAAIARRIEEGSGSGAEAPPPVRPMGRDRPLPLSFAQQRLWFLDRLGEGGAVYNVPVALVLRGPLDVAALERSLAEILVRHEVLRTRILEVDGQPVQVIAPGRPSRLPVVDLAGLGAGAAAEAERLRRSEARRPFDLTSQDLLRVRLLTFGGAEHQLLLTLHHLAADGWSGGVLSEELRQLYAAFAAGRRSPLPALPVQYADYAIWQRGWLRGEVLEGQLEYWREQLAGIPAELALPADRPRPARESFRGDTLYFHLGAGLAEAIDELSRRRGTTPYMTLLACLQSLLARYSGQGDVVVGSPIANRARPELEGLVGFFSNTLVMRSRVSARESFASLLARVRETSLGAYAHQDLPFERLVEEVRPERHRSRSPIFQVALSLQNAPQPKLVLGDLELEMLPPETGTSKFDLNLSLDGGREGMDGFLEFSTDLFDRTTARRILGHFEVHLRGILEDPHRPLGEVPWLTPGERHQVVVEAARGVGLGRPAPAPVHRRFAERAAERPDAVALAADGAVMTYGELAARVRGLAGALVERGVGPGDRVALVFEHSFETVVALLAVLETGAAYVPFDPDYPQERLALVLDDARVAGVLTQERWLARLRSIAPEGLELLALDSPEGRPPRADGSASALREVPEEATAYVLYTSGSTGRPKGVAIPHRALATYVDWAAREYVGDEACDFPLCSLLGFDLTVTSVLTPLVTGNRLVVYRMEGRDVADVVADDRAEVVKLTPSHLALVAARSMPAPGRLRRLVVGGEALARELAERVRRQLSAQAGSAGTVEILNEYGPTEATVGCSLHRFDPSDPRTADRPTVPIGRPATHAELLVLDPELAPVGLGVVGELHLGGAELADGYVGKPQRTAAAFVPHPWGGPGERLYRSGDLARRLSGGVLDFLGRRDEQVKIHGYRVELEEIRAALRRHPDVRDAVMRLLDDGAEHPVLVAYYAARHEVPASGLRDHLAGFLVEAVVPQHFVHLRRLPLTLNGKVALDALPDLGEIRGRSRGEIEPPRTPTEEILAGLWGQLLGLEQVGAEESFFELGGHSLLATQLTSRIRQELGVELPLAAVFDSPTVRGLAARVDTLRRSGGPEAPPIERLAHEEGTAPLSFAQQRLWLMEQLAHGDGEGDDAGAYGVMTPMDLEGGLDVAALAASFDRIVERHEVLRSTFETRDGTPVQVIHPAAPVPLPVVCLSGLDREGRRREADRLIVAQSRRPFDLERGPLLRLRLLRLEADRHVLLADMHHIVVDGWSLGVLVSELVELYGAAVADRDPELPELPIQYRDFAVWQRRWLSGERLEAQLERWERRLEGAPPLLALPTDRPRPRVQGFRGASRTFRLSAETRAGLEALARERGVTLFMALLAVLGTLLFRVTGQPDLVVGTGIANRNRRETEDLIGFFVNMLALRLDLGPAMRFEEALQKAREVTLEAYANQDMPFERVIQHLGLEGETRYTPYLQVVLLLQNLPEPSLLDGELSLAPYEVDLEISHWELMWVFHEDGDELAGIVQYNADLFDATTIERLTSHFEVLARGVVQSPNLPLLDIPMERGAVDDAATPVAASEVRVELEKDQFAF